MANETLQPVQLFRPAWADPGFIISSNDRQYRDYTLAAGVVQRVALNNPKRWGIGFVQQMDLTNDVRIGPWPDPNVLSVTEQSINGLFMFTLFNHGTLVTGEWYAVSGGGATLRVIELEIG